MLLPLLAFLFCGIETQGAALGYLLAGLTGRKNFPTRKLADVEDFSYLCIIIMFTIRAYGRRELAQLYFPHLSPNSAWRCLHRWINLNQELCRKLNGLGYDAQTRIFTPEQVRVLSYYLGEP